jgi:hypothetical protein
MAGVEPQRPDATGSFRATAYRSAHATFVVEHDVHQQPTRTD